MQKLIFTNGDEKEIDLTSGAFGITYWEGLSNTELNIQTQQVPFNDGGVFLDALMEQREITVTVAIEDGGDLEKRYELKRQLISALNPKLGEGVLVYRNDFLAKQIKAVPQLPIFENKNSNDVGTLKATVTFSCPSPYWEDLEETVVMFKGNKIIENSGDVPVGMKMKIPVGSKNPTIINQSGEKEISLLGTFSEGELNINTEVGNKKIESEILKFEWSQGLVSFNDVAFGNKKYVYVSSKLIIVESIITGEYKVIKNLDVNLNKVVYFEESSIFMAVGSKTENGSNVPAILKSSDGETWTSLELPSGLTGALKSLIYWQMSAYSKGYASVGTNGLVLTSSDGETWNSVSVFYFTSKNLCDIAYIKDFFVVIGEGGFVYTGRGLSQGTVHTLTDVTENLNSISYSDYYDRAIIVGNSGRIIFGIPPVNYGGGWSFDIRIQGTINFKKALADEDRYYIVGENGNFFNSSNGDDWENQVIGNSQASLNSIKKIIGEFIVVGSGGEVLTSSDGETWTEKKSYISENFADIKFFEKFNLFVILFGSGATYISADGKNWRYNKITNNILKSITYSEQLGLFVIVGTRIILFSRDLENWTELATSYNLNSVTYSEKLGLFVAVGNSGTIITSPDGENWTQQTSGVSVILNSITYSEKLGLFVVAGNSKNILTSPDGENWTQIIIAESASSSFNLNSVTYSEKLGLFVAVGTYKSKIISSDGVHWSASISWHSQYYQYVYVSYLKDKFILLERLAQLNNQKSWVVKSSDGVHLYIIETLSDSFNIQIPKAVAYSEKLDLFVLVCDDSLNGASQAILTSTYQKKNVINKLTQNSDMSLSLNTGKNNLFYFDDDNLEVTLSYRQKYIGV